MLSFAMDLRKKEKESKEIKPLTVCFWSDFISNPSIMYNLFESTPRKLNYDPDKVKVMGTKDGMINQINVSTVEDLDSIHEELLGVPLLMRIFVQNSVEEQGGDTGVKWEGDLALLVDTSHPMIRPQLEQGLDRCRKILQSQGLFCLEINFVPAVEQWLKETFPRHCCTITLSSFRLHQARLFITNHVKPQHCFDCGPMWYILGPCWLFSAPFYQCFRKSKCVDVVIVPSTSIVRRAVLPSGKCVEITRCKGSLRLTYYMPPSTQEEPKLGSPSAPSSPAGAMPPGGIVFPQSLNSQSK